jgi:drug/metabolite transporter (DMT)-like permease
MMFYLIIFIAVCSSSALKLQGTNGRSAENLFQKICVRATRLDSSILYLKSRKSIAISMSAAVSSEEAPARVLKDYAILAIVPLVWGSYSPLVKGLYSAAEVVAPPPLIFNLLSYFVSASALTVVQYMSSWSKNSKNELITANKVVAASEPDSVKGLSLEWTAGIELGLWLFLGSTVQISGIQLTTAIRAAILVQLTTILVPFLETILVNKKAISTKLWTSCIIAMLGVITVSTDGGSVGSIISSFTFSSIDKSFFALLENIKFNTGDLLVSSSAVFYSMHVIRLGNFASRVSPLKLAQVKSLTELVLSAAAISLVCLLGGNDMNSLSQFSKYAQVVKTSFLESGQIYVLLAVLWNGAFATALTTWAQTVGQRSVSPTTANLLYSSQPIWAALISFSFLNESISNSTLIGSFLLFIAVTYSLYTPSNPAKDPLP